MVGSGRGGVGLALDIGPACGRLRPPQDTRRTDPMAAVRTATVTWQGSLAEGSGSVSAGTSGLFTDLPVSWGSRPSPPRPLVPQGLLRRSGGARLRGGGAARRG